MHVLHVLDGTSTPLGDPKPAIDAYEQAAQAAQVLFATDPVTQSAIDAYLEHVGSVADFIGHQAAIAAAISDTGC
jgi:hypothetical protein